MNFGATDPAQLEQLWLSNLDEQYKLVQKNLQAFLADPRLRNSPEMAPWVSYLSQAGDYFTQYKTMALYLKGLGFGDLYDQVERVLAELQQANLTYAQMYKSAMGDESKMIEMNRAATQTWFDTMQSVMKTHQAAFDAANASWEAAFKKTDG
jgi:hypothetical protein